MKKILAKLLTSLLFFVLIIGCSNESSDTNINENTGNDTGDNNTGGNDTNTYKFIKSIREENAPSNNTGAQFIYEDEKLVFVHLYECSGQSYAFDYNAEGKIAKRYSGALNNFDISTLDIVAFKANANLVLNYIYNNSILTDIQSNDGFVHYHFSYDSNDRLQLLEWFYPGIGLWQKNTITYNGDGNIINLNKKEYTTTGVLDDDKNYTFEFDNNPNPFIAFNESFGLYTFYTCQGIDYISSMDTGLKIFQNNPITVYEDGELLFNSTYEYDSEGYPTRMSYTDLNGNVSGVDLITYEP